MIFYIFALLLFIFSIYLISGKWTNILFRILFAVISTIIIIIIVLFGLEFKINIHQIESEKRVIVCAVDISASSGLDINNIKEKFENHFTDYNVEIVPFSNKLRGVENSQSSLIVDSVNEFLSYVSHQYTDDKVAAVLIISDGNETEKISYLKKEITLNGSYPHNVAYLKNNRKARGFDKSVVFLDVPRFIPRFSKEKISFAVHVTKGNLNGVPVDLKLNGKVIGSVFVSLDDGYGTGEFELIIKKVGNYLLEASIAKDSRESYTANNNDYVQIEGILKGFRVLHVSGHPSTDTSAIRRGLQNIPGVDMISFYILRTRDQAMGVSESELSLIPFPTDQLFRKELDNFDLIIINDFMLTEFLSPLYINNIVKFAESGGALLIFGGPYSYKAKDFANNRFKDILPAVPVNGANWNKNENIFPVSQDITNLTSMSELKSLKGAKLNGLNNVKLKDESNVFFTSSNGKPLMAGLYTGKGRVVAVMTDSLWRMTYSGGMNNELYLKSFVRYLLGVSTMPVKISGNFAMFDESLLDKNNKQISAELNFLNPDGSSTRKETLIVGSAYKLREKDSRIIDVKIHNKKNLVDHYKLININEKKDNEFTFVPSGKDFLEMISDKGDGEFIEMDTLDIGDSLKDISVKSSIFLAEKKIKEVPIYKHAGILVILLYLSMMAFYLKSRYYD